MTIWYSLWPFALFYASLVYFVFVCDIIAILAYCIKKKLVALLTTTEI
jgi:uncharacterized membrane protein